MLTGAICPKDGKGAALVMPRCDTEAMNLRLAAPGAQAGGYDDDGGHPMLGSTLVRDPNFTDRVVAETRALLATIPT